MCFIYNTLCRELEVELACLDRLNNRESKPEPFGHFSYYLICNRDLSFYNLESMAGRIRRSLTLILVTLSLLVSAVSACACSHHQPDEPAKASSSCHASSHGEVHKAPPIEGVRSNAIDTDCECFVRNPVPVIAAKSDTKKAKADSSDDLTAEAPDDGISFESASVITQPPPSQIGSKYLSPQRHSGPARAPPRL